jgi:hypothetical protein
VNALALADRAGIFEPLKPGEDLIETGAYVLVLGLDPAANVVQRLRLPHGGVEDTVGEIRAAVRAHGGTSLIWEVSDLATPADLADRLRAFGAVPAPPPSEPTATVMALSEPPAPAPAEVTVSRVESTDAFKTYVTVTHEVFGMQERLPAELERIDREGAEDVADARFVRYVAWLDSEPVGAASATFGDTGVILNAGCTRERARGRGAYRALVRARWDDAVARGTPALVTKAGAMSAPILARLGFEKVGELRLFLDRV